MLSLEKVVPEDFAACLKQDFEVTTEIGVAIVKLVGVERRGAGHPGRREPFSLTFEGAKGLRLPQAIYLLTNQTLGGMEIFLVQIASGEEGSSFEAVFN